MIKTLYSNTVEDHKGRPVVIVISAEDNLIYVNYLYTDEIANAISFVLDWEAVTLMEKRLFHIAQKTTDLSSRIGVTLNRSNPDYTVEIVAVYNADNDLVRLAVKREGTGDDDYFVINDKLSVFNNILRLLKDNANSDVSMTSETIKLRNLSMTHDDVVRETVSKTRRRKDE